MTALRANERLRRDVDRQLRRRLSRAKTALERIDALFAAHALRHKLADRSIDLELADLERQVGLKSPPPLPWPETSAPIVDHSTAFMSRVERVATAMAVYPSRLGRPRKAVAPRRQRRKQFDWHAIQEERQRLRLHSP